MTINTRQLIDDMKLPEYLSENLDDLSEEHLELISKFAPIIASMVRKDSYGEWNYTGKDIFDKLISLDKEKLTEINKSYDECKGDDQKDCLDKIIEQINNV